MPLARGARLAPDDRAAHTCLAFVGIELEQPIDWPFRRARVARERVREPINESRCELDSSRRIERRSAIHEALEHGELVVSEPSRARVRDHISPIGACRT